MKIRGKKVGFLMIVAVTIIGSVVIQKTIAQFQLSAEVTRTISTASLDVGLNIEGGQTDKDGNVLVEQSQLKDGRVNQKVTVVNTGNKNIYVRVKVSKAWYENQTKVLQVGDKEVDANAISLAYINMQDWIVPVDGNISNGEDIYIYYKSMLKPGEATSSFMEALIFFEDNQDNTNQYAGLDARIQYDADAIQTVDVSQAMLSEWHVNVSFDVDGNLTSVVNQ